MTKLFFTMAVVLLGTEVSAQQSTAMLSNNDSSVVNTATVGFSEQVGNVWLTQPLSEPEFVNNCCILTSDTTYSVLPIEYGVIEKHKSKSSKILGKIGNIADKVGAVGSLGASLGIATNNSDVLISGLKASSTAMRVGDVTDAAGILTKAVGMDVVIKTKASAFKYEMNGDDIRILIKAENNDYDPNQLYRVVKFATSKKERRIQWAEINPGAMDEDDKRKGYMPFMAKKYGKQSYILTIPASEIEKGEYGIFYMKGDASQYIPVGTFGIS